jgi:hypothetical protein
VEKENEGDFWNGGESVPKIPFIFFLHISPTPLFPLAPASLAFFKVFGTDSPQKRIWISNNRKKGRKKSGEGKKLG